MGKVLSIEIGNSSIRICQMDYKVKNPRVYRHVTIPTPKGAISDGYLTDLKALKESIRSALAAHKMKNTNRVIFTIASGKIVTREVILPPVKQNLIESLIRTNINEYFPIDLSSYKVSYLILEKYAEGNDAGKYKVQIMAAEKALIEDYRKLAAACGLSLIQMDYVGNSIYQAFKNEDIDSCVMVLKIEETQTAITVIQNQSLALQRSINYGYKEAIEETVRIPVYNAIDDREAWEPLINGVTRVMDFYRSRNGGVQIDKIRVTGMGGNITGLSTLFTNELDVETTVVKQLKGVAWHELNEKNDLCDYVACIGATFAPIGFAQKERKEREGSGKEHNRTSFRASAILIALFTIAAVGLLGFVSYNDYQMALDEQQKLKVLESRYLEAEQTYLAYNNLSDLYQEVLEGSLLMKNPNDNLLELFKALEEVLPSNVIINGFSSGETQCTINMQVDDRETAAGVLQKLREIDSLMSVSVTSIAETTEGTDSYVTFSIVCTYYPVEYEATE